MSQQAFGVCQRPPRRTSEDDPPGGWGNGGMLELLLEAEALGRQRTPLLAAGRWVDPSPAPWRSRAHTPFLVTRAMSPLAPDVTTCVARPVWRSPTALAGSFGRAVAP